VLLVLSPDQQCLPFAGTIESPGELQLTDAPHSPWFKLASADDPCSSGQASGEKLLGGLSSDEGEACAFSVLQRASERSGALSHGKHPSRALKAVETRGDKNSVLPPLASSQGFRASEESHLNITAASMPSRHQDLNLESGSLRSTGTGISTAAASTNSTARMRYLSRLLRKLHKRKSTNETAVLEARRQRLRNLQTQHSGEESAFDSTNIIAVIVVGICSTFCVVGVLLAAFMGMEARTESTEPQEVTVSRSPLCEELVVPEGKRLICLVEKGLCKIPQVKTLVITSEDSHPVMRVTADEVQVASPTISLESVTGDLFGTLSTEELCRDDAEDPKVTIVGATKAAYGKIKKQNSHYVVMCNEAVVLTVKGNFTGHSFVVTGEKGDIIGQVEPAEDEETYYQVTVESGIDAGLVILAVLAVDKFERLPQRVARIKSEKAAAPAAPESFMDRFLNDTKKFLVSRGMPDLTSYVH